LQIAEKSWAVIDPFLEAYGKALELLNPKGREAIDFGADYGDRSGDSFRTELRRR
jgi:hypothetical protein